MDLQKAKQARRLRRKHHIRNSLSGTAARPRLTVFRSNKHISCQLVDDESGKTLAAVSTQQKAVSSEVSGKGKIPAATREGAGVVGRLIAEKAKEAGVTQVVFDRNGYKFHGRIAELAKAARDGGLKF